MRTRAIVFYSAVALGIALTTTAHVVSALPLPGQVIEPAPPNHGTGPVNGTVKLTIPVNLVQIPSNYPKFSVQCSFRYVNGGTGQGTEFSRFDGSLVNGSYSGNVSLTLTLQSSTASAVNGYKCDLYLFPPSPGTGTIPGPSNADPAAQPRPNTTFLGHVEGGF